MRTLSAVLLLCLPWTFGAGCAAPVLEPAESVARADDDAGHSFLVGLLLYVPNRILDLFDVARAGVEVGPGLGIRLQATELAQLGIMSRISAGVGLETLRHLPVKAAAETYAGVGPLDAEAGLPLPWYHDRWDVLVDVHLLILGAHVAVNPMEIADFVTGLVGVDLRDDDL